MNCIFRQLLGSHTRLESWLDSHAREFSPIFLRLLLAYEFAEAGLEKWHGENWFAELTFPFPFNSLPSEFLWQLSVFLELACPAALILGFMTRIACFMLIILTVVAIAAVHWPAEWHSLGELWQGYSISDNGHGNFKLPLMYIIMLASLFFSGAGSLSVDHFLRKIDRSHC